MEAGSSVVAAGVRGQGPQGATLCGALVGVGPTVGGRSV